MQVADRKLKSDIFGRVERVVEDGKPLLRRVACGSRVPGTRVAARILAVNEQRALEMLEHLPFTPRGLGRAAAGVYLRGWLEGLPLYQAAPYSDEFFGELVRRVEAMHAAGVVHNDLAKEANVLALADGSPGLIDFQVALRFPASRRPRWLFDLLRAEDLRHALKHKACYRPDLLTDDDRRRLARRSWPVELWRRTFMRPYQRLVVWLGWEPARGPEGR